MLLPKTLIIKIGFEISKLKFSRRVFEAAISLSVKYILGRKGSICPFIIGFKSCNRFSIARPATDKGVLFSLKV